MDDYKGMSMKINGTQGGHGESGGVIYLLFVENRGCQGTTKS